MKEALHTKTITTRHGNPIVGLPGDRSCDLGMEVIFKAEWDTGETDSRILAHFPHAKLERGLRYARWAVFDSLLDAKWIRDSVATLNAEGFYSNYILGKPLTILFFCRTQL